jgi:hypothetical protein
VTHHDIDDVLGNPPPGSARCRKSPSVTLPTSLPFLDITGNPVILFASIDCIASRSRVCHNGHHFWCHRVSSRIHTLP